LNQILLKGEIELDETLLFKAKKSHAIHRPFSKELWLFGLIKRGTREFILIPLNSKKETELHNLILKFAKIGSTLCSDSYSCYVNIFTFPKKPKLMDYVYIHYFINHKVEFRSKLFHHIHTNNVENLWKNLKESIKRTKMFGNQEYTITIFYFHTTLSQGEQMDMIREAIQKKNLNLNILSHFFWF